MRSADGGNDCGDAKADVKADGDVVEEAAAAAAAAVVVVVAWVGFVDVVLYVD